MSLIAKLAESDQELRDVFSLRYKVFCVEKENLKVTNDFLPGVIVDQFDSYSGCRNYIIYDGTTPVAVGRLNLDSEQGLPAEKIVDISLVRGIINSETSGLLASISMLAVDKEWRNTKALLLLFRAMAVDVEEFKVTHLVAAISNRTFPLYKRMGFSRLGPPIWSEIVNDHISLIASQASVSCGWARSTMEKNMRLVNEV